VSAYRDEERSAIDILHKLAGFHPRIVFMSLKVMLAGYKCSLSMMTVGCSIDYTAQCSIRSTCCRRAE